MDPHGTGLKPQVSQLLAEYVATSQNLFAKLRIETAAEGVKNTAAAEGNSTAACMKSLVALDEQLQETIAKLAQQQARQREIESLNQAIAEKDLGLQHMATNLVQAEEVLSEAIDKAKSQITEWKAASKDAVPIDEITDYAHRIAFTNQLPPYFREGNGPFHCFPTEEHMHFSKVFDRPAEPAAEPAIEVTPAKVGDKRPASAVDTAALIRQNSQPLMSPTRASPPTVSAVQLGGFGMDSDSDSDSDSE